MLDSHTFRTPRHTTRYLESGPEDGPLMMFVHGFPSIGLIWRRHLEALAAEGWHCLAPDMRGYGGSAAPESTQAYAIEHIVADMVELHDHVGGRPAVWVGHDWGSVVAGSIAAHEPERALAVALTSWAYYPQGNSLDTLVSLVDRSIYPAEEYPDGQWDYYRYYQTHFDDAVADLDANVEATLASAYRCGSPADARAVSPLATVTRNGGRFGAAHRAPSTTPDPALWTPQDFRTLVSAFGDHGFRGPSAWYTNDDANAAYAATAVDDGRLTMPVLFVNGAWDAICNVVGNHQGDPMRAACSDLTETSIPAGHWLPLERPQEHLDALRTWLHANGWPRVGSNR